MLRSSLGGKEIGDEYQSACIESWKKSGFRPISINSATELLPEYIATQCEVIRLGRDARSEYGKPVLFLKDFLEAISDVSDGVVAITNSDILIEFSPEQQRAIASLEEDECVVLKRRDVTSMESAEGEEYLFGYDFIAVHAGKVARINSGPMAIGIPWWDQFLPLFFMLTGQRHVDVGPGIFHLLHDDRWDWTNWIEIGSRFESILEESLRSEEISKREWSDYLAQIKRNRGESSLDIVGRIKRELKALLGLRSERGVIGRFHRLSETNIGTIDRWRAIHGSHDNSSNKETAV